MKIQKTLLFYFLQFGFLFCVSAIINLSVNLLYCKILLKYYYFGIFRSSGFYVLTGDKSNEVLLFSFFPLAILGTNFIEYARKKQHHRISFGILILSTLPVFLSIIPLLPWPNLRHRSTQE
jgi:hypothetical protein